MPFVPFFFFPFQISIKPSSLSKMKTIFTQEIFTEQVNRFQFHLAQYFYLLVSVVIYFYNLQSIVYYTLAFICSHLRGVKKKIVMSYPHLLYVKNMFSKTLQIVKSLVQCVLLAYPNQYYYFIKFYQVFYQRWCCLQFF